MHGHSHNHYLSITQEDFQRSRNSLLLSLGLSIIIIFLEIYGAYSSNSLALLSDAFHILADISSHLISLFALWLSHKPKSIKYTFGYARVEILAALVNSILLVFLCGFLMYHSVERILNPLEIAPDQMFYFSSIALVLNVLSAYVLYRVSHLNINLRSAFLHSFGDMLGTLAVVLGSVIIYATGWVGFDYIITFFIVIIILRATWHLLEEILLTLMEANPNPERSMEIVKRIQDHLGYNGITFFHHWFLTPQIECFQCQVFIKNKNLWESIVPSIHKILKEEYGIQHVSVEIVTKESSIVLETIQKKSLNPTLH